jgi:hypothetical protein
MFVKFDRNINFIPDEFLTNIVARLEEMDTRGFIR